jgi:hypothetical protein
VTPKDATGDEIATQGRHLRTWDCVHTADNTPTSAGGSVSRFVFPRRLKDKFACGSVVDRSWYKLTDGYVDSFTIMYYREYQDSFETTPKPKSNAVTLSMNTSTGPLIHRHAIPVRFSDVE